MKLVTDANVWIDLDNGELVALTFDLPYEFASPDVVVAELGPDLGGLLRDQGLLVVAREQAIDEDWAELRVRYKHPSDEDLYALLLAAERRWGLLTGDRELRQAAEEEGLEVHGVLWVLDELLGEGLLAPRAAERALSLMLELGARLPADECGKRMAHWGKA